MYTIKEMLEIHADSIQEFWFDVDGVMTPKGAITIYDVRKESTLVGFERNDGIDSIRLVPCNEEGQPLKNIVEYIAGNVGEPIFEGYRFDTRDGQVIQYLVQNGFPVYFISGRDSPCVRKRAQTLGAVAFLGAKDKYATIKEYGKCDMSHLLFVGDGIQDCETMRAVGVAIAPADASMEAIHSAHAVTHALGGDGVIHEVVTEFLKIRGLWPV